MKFVGEDIRSLISRKTTILNIGAPFTGKTKSIGTLITLKRHRNESGKVVVFDWDAKSAPLVRDAIANKWLDDLILYQFTTSSKISTDDFTKKQVATFIEFCQHVNNYHDMVDPRTGLWRDPNVAPWIIVLDSLTNLQAHILEFTMAKVGHDLGARNTDSRADYGKQIAKTMEVIKSLKSLPCHLVVTCHEQFDKDEVTGEIRMEPLVTGRKLPQELIKEFNVVVYSIAKPDGKGGTEYRWQMRPSGYVKSVGSTYIDDLPQFVPQDFRYIIQ